MAVKTTTTEAHRFSTVKNQYQAWLWVNINIYWLNYPAHTTTAGILKESTGWSSSFKFIVALHKVLAGLLGMVFTLCIETLHVVVYLQSFFVITLTEAWTCPRIKLYYQRSKCTYGVYTFKNLENHDILKNKLMPCF